jgi:gamma-glutamyltranspeptidase/glutathione hydrolase
MTKNNLHQTASFPIAAVICLAVTIFQQPAFADTATGQRGVIATVHPAASEAGRNAFEQGGNAIDAAIAAAVTLGVVDGHNSGLGGGCLILIRRVDGTLLAIDGRETAPESATRDMYVRDDVAVPTLSQDGALAIGVPGALAAYQKAMTKKRGQGAPG